MSSAILIHDDPCMRAYVYVDGDLVASVSKQDRAWQDAIAEALGQVDEVTETEGVVDQCGPAPESINDWTGLQPIERDGDGSLAAIIGIYALGCVATLIFNDEYIFGEDIFFPDDVPGW